MVVACLPALPCRAVPIETALVLAFAHSVIATIRQPLLLLDGHSVVRAANAAFCREFELDPDEIVGRVVFEIDRGQWNVPELHRLVAGVHAGVAIEGFELQQDAREGRRTIVIDARQARGDDGLTVVVLAVDDVTERRLVQGERERLHAELEVRVKERTTDLETANTELEAFAYSVSHDLRTPLRAIDGFSAQLLSRYAELLDDRGQHYLRRVRANTQQMGQLIDDLLQLSRLGRERVRHERIDLTAVVTSLAAELQALEPERRVSFEIQPDLLCAGDPGLIGIALQNLIANAWKFTGATVAATIAFGQAGAEYFVRDNGAGFDMSHAGKLFGAFQRLHPQQQFPGNGIGLALVQRVIHRHGGRVRAEGAPGLGASFFFTLPEPESP